MSGLFQAVQLTEDSQRAITIQIAAQFNELFEHRLDTHGLRNVAEAHLNLKASVDMILVDGQKSRKT